MPDVFVSYSRRDGEFVQRLHAALTARGKDVWVDWEDIPPTADWLAHIKEGIDSSDAFLFVVSPDSVISAVCNQEVAHATASHKRIIPLLLRQIDAATAPGAVASHNWISFANGVAFDEQVETLVRAMDTDLAWVQGHTKRLNQALEWDRRGRDPSLLLRGADLTAAEQWLQSGADKQPRPTQLQIEYLQASRQGATRRQRTITAAVSVALVVAVVLAVAALIERGTAIGQRKSAQSRELAANATEVLPNDPELSVLLASKGLQIKHSAQAESALRQALLNDYLRTTVNPRSGARSLTIDAAGSLAATVGRDGAVRVWRPQGGRALGRLPGVVAAKALFAGRGPRLLTVSRDGRAQVWNAARPGEPLTLGATAVRDAVWGPNDTTVVTGAADGTVSLWSAATGAQGAHVRLHAPVAHLALGPGFVAAGERGARAGIVLWHPASGHAVRLPAGEPGDAVPVVSPDGARVLSAGGGAAELWNGATGARVATLPISAAAGDAAFSPDSKDLAIGGEALKVFDGRTGADSGITYTQNFSSINSLLFTNGGDDLALAGGDGRITILHWVDQTVVSVLHSGAGGVGDLSLTPDGRHLGSIDLQTGTAKIWEPGMVESLWSASGSVQPALSRDGRRALVGGGPGNPVRVVDAATGRRISVLAGAASQLGATGFDAAGDEVLGVDGSGLHVWRSADGRRIAFVPRTGIAYAGLSGDGRHLAIGTKAGVELLRVGAARGRFLRGAVGGAFTLDGRSFAELLPGAAVVRDLGTGAVRHTLRVAKRAAWTVVAWSGDARRIALGAGRRVQVFDADGQPAGPAIATAGPLQSLALDHAGDRVVAGERANGLTQVWDVRTGHGLGRFAQSNSNYAETIDVARLSADGRFVLGASGTDGARIWEVATGSQLESFGQSGYVGWSADGRRLLMQGEQTMMYPCDVCQGPDALERLAAARVTRTLTPGERLKYLP